MPVEESINAGWSERFLLTLPFFQSSNHKLLSPRPEAETTNLGWRRERGVPGEGTKTIERFSGWRRFGGPARVQGGPTPLARGCSETRPVLFRHSPSESRTLAPTIPAGASLDAPRPRPLPQVGPLSQPIRKKPGRGRRSFHAGSDVYAWLAADSAEALRGR